MFAPGTVKGGVGTVGFRIGSTNNSIRYTNFCGRFSISDALFRFITNRNGELVNKVRSRIDVLNNAKGCMNKVICNEKVSKGLPVVSRKVSDTFNPYFRTRRGQ